MDSYGSLLNLDLIFCYVLLSTPILGIERRTEVNLLLTHNASLTSYY